MLQLFSLSHNIFRERERGRRIILFLKKRLVSIFLKQKKAILKKKRLTLSLSEYLNNIDFKLIIILSVYFGSKKKYII